MGCPSAPRQVICFVCDHRQPPAQCCTWVSPMLVGSLDSFPKELRSMWFGAENTAGSGSRLEPQLTKLNQLPDAVFGSQNSPLSGSQFAEYFCSHCNFWDDVTRSKFMSSIQHWKHRGHSRTASENRSSTVTRLRTVGTRCIEWPALSAGQVSAGHIDSNRMLRAQSAQHVSLDVFNILI